MSGGTGVAVLIGRLLFAYFFGVVAGIGHFKKDQQMRGYAVQAGFPVPAVAGWVAGVWLIVGAASVGLGIWPDLGALMIGAFVIPATLCFHRFWSLGDEALKTSQRQAFDRNILILGASLVFFGTFVTLGSELRFAITAPLFNF
ncbi:MAG: putative oxidoreductase [Actinomycetota bacterium]|nr:putative oxidoreductase [Actinomycetota bacterium]